MGMCMSTPPVTAVTPRMNAHKPRRSARVLALIILHVPVLPPLTAGQVAWGGAGGKPELQMFGFQRLRTVECRNDQLAGRYSPSLNRPRRVVKWHSKVRRRC